MKTANLPMEEFSFHELIEYLKQYRLLIGIALIAIPAASFILGYILKKASPRMANGFLAVMVYISVLPGICMALVIGYLMFLQKTNILSLDLVLYFGPIGSMLTTLYLINRIAKFDDIPGFDRLSGLIMMVSVAFIVTFFLYKLRFIVGFFASVWVLIGLFIALLLFFMLGLAKFNNKK